MIQSSTNKNRITCCWLFVVVSSSRPSRTSSACLPCAAPAEHPSQRSLSHQCCLCMHSTAVCALVDSIVRCRSGGTLIITCMQHRRCPEVASGPQGGPSVSDCDELCQIHPHSCAISCERSTACLIAPVLGLTTLQFSHRCGVVRCHQRGRSHSTKVESPCRCASGLRGARRACIPSTVLLLPDLHRPLVPLFP